MNVALPIDNEKASLLDFHLDLKGIACSKGSACQSGSTSGSHVLNSIQSKELRQRPSLRFSFSIFNSINEVDYVITSLKGVQDFLSRPSKLTQIEFNTSQLNKYSVQEALQASVGPDFKVKSRYQQNEFLYKVLQTEKWAIFFILSFI